MPRPRTHLTAARRSPQTHFAAAGALLLSVACSSAADPSMGTDTEPNGAGTPSNMTPTGPGTQPGTVPTDPGTEPAQGQAGFELLASKASRATPQLSAEEQTQHALDRLDFNWALYAELAKETGNFFYSAHSISTALAMLYAAAGGDTKTEMQTALHFSQPDATLHSGFNRLELELESRNIAAAGNGLGVTVRTNNDVWNDIDYLDPANMADFLDPLAIHYGAGVKLIDFDDADESRRIINEAVAEQTSDTVPELLPEGVITPGVTAMILTNTLYFKAGWAVPFEKQQTAKADFFSLSGKTESVDMMRGVQPLEYAEDDALQVVRIPYEQGQTALVVLLPKAGEFTTIDRSAGRERFASLFESMEPKMVSLQLPKFTLRSPLGLKPVLQELGMRAAFHPGGLPKISSDAFVQAVVHEAFIATDEAGTEAGAATAVVVGIESAGPEPEVEFTANRPFIMLLEDIPTRSVLFAGRYVTAK